MKKDGVKHVCMYDVHYVLYVCVCVCVCVKALITKNNLGLII